MRKEWSVRHLILSLLVLTLVAIPALAGCAEREATPTATGTATATASPTATTPTTAPTPTPTTTAPVVRKPEGTLTVVTSSLGSETLVPWHSAAVESYISFINQTLLERKFGTRKIVGNLAEKWELSNGGRTWTFYLRKGIPWDGPWGELTAEDIKFSAERYAGKDSRAVRLSVFRDVQSIEIANPYQVTFQFKTPQAQLTYMLTDARPDFMIVSKKYFETVGEEQALKKPVGTGPWRFVERKIGEYIKLEAVDNHWKHTPYFKTLIIKIVPEAASRIAMVKTGEADITDISLSYKKEAVKAGIDMRRFEGAISNTIKFGGQVLPTWKDYDPTIPWVDGDSPWRALKVRQAMNLAIDRQAIIDTILAGEAVLLANNLVVPGTPWSDPAWKPYPYDPERARALLAEAGYPRGFELTMWVFSFPGRGETAEFAQAVGQYWERIGIKVKYEVAEYGVKRAVMATRNYRGGFTFPVPHPIWDEPADNWSAAYNSKAALNLGFEDPRVDKLLVDLGAEADMAKRAEINRQIGDIIYSEYREAPIAYTNLLYGVSGKVGVFPQMPSYSQMHYYEYVTHKGQQP